MFRYALAFVLSISFVFGQVVVDQATTDVNERIRQLSFLNRTGAEYRLGAGDLIEVSVFGVDNFKYNLRINSSGEITLPFIGNVQAAGMTPAELEHDLKTGFEQGFIKNPQVSVFVKEYRSQPVFVLGAVRQPGQYQMVNQLNLVDVLAMAGGLVPEKAADEVIIQRGNHRGTEAQRDGTENVIKVDLKALLEGGDLALNVPVQGGDVVHVPERKRDLFYVVGEVNRAGAYEIPPKNDVFVSQAIAWAAGPMKTAKMSKGILVRYDGNGGRKEMAVNFENILEGKKPDFLIQPNDIIFIPGSTAKTIGYGLLGIIPSTASGAIIYGPLVR